MSSKQAEPRSIASQLVLFYTLAAALLLCCGFGALYWIVIRHAFEEDNEVLADKVAAVRMDLGAAGPQLVSEGLQQVRAGERATYWLRVLDSNGQTLAETPGMTALLPPSVFSNAMVQTGVEIAPVDFRASGRLFSLVAIQDRVGADTYVIQVAQDRSADEGLSLIHI